MRRGAAEYAVADEGGSPKGETPAFVAGTPLTDEPGFQQGLGDRIPFPEGLQFPGRGESAHLERRADTRQAGVEVARSAKDLVRIEGDTTFADVRAGLLHTRGAETESSQLRMHAHERTELVIVGVGRALARDCLGCRHSDPGKRTDVLPPAFSTTGKNETGIRSRIVSKQMAPNPVRRYFDRD